MADAKPGISSREPMARSGVNLAGIAPPRKAPSSRDPSSTRPRESVGSTARRAEALRQATETFNQRQMEAAAWFRLRLWMGRTALTAFVGLVLASVFVLADHTDFPRSAATYAAVAILAEAVGLMVAVWRLVLGPGPATLEPISVEDDRP
jgi:hypothetical protein